MSTLEIIFLAWALLSSAVAFFFWRKFIRERSSYWAFARGVNDARYWTGGQNTNFLPALQFVTLALSAMVIWKNREKLKKLFR